MHFEHLDKSWQRRTHHTLPYQAARACSVGDDCVAKAVQKLDGQQAVLPRQVRACKRKDPAKLSLSALVPIGHGCLPPDSAHGATTQLSVEELKRSMPDYRRRAPRSNIQTPPPPHHHHHHHSLTPPSSRQHLFHGLCVQAPRPSSPPPLLSPPSPHSHLPPILGLASGQKHAWLIPPSNQPYPVPTRSCT